MNSLDFYLALFGGCKRDVARVAGKVGGLTNCVFTGLCGALPEAKGKGGEMQGAYSKANSGMEKAVFILGVFALILSGCGNPKRVKQEHITSDDAENIISYVTDSINPWGNRILKFGNDSVYAFNEDSVISYILYLDTTMAIKRIIFENGKKSYIEYNPFIAKNLIQAEYFFPDTNIPSHQYYFRDSIIFTEGNPIKVYQYGVSYHKNGKIEYSGHQGVFIANGVAVGVWHYYDSLGFLTKTHNYIYPKDYGDFYPYVIVSEYFLNGKPKWEKLYYNNDSFDAGEEYRIPIRTWKYFSEKGVLYKTEEYENGELIKTEKHNL